MSTSNKQIIYSCASDIGRLRQNNQDNLVCDGIYMNNDSGTDRFSLAGTADAGESRLFGVFDGMGGEECGEMAAFIAAKDAASLKMKKVPDRELKEFCFRINRKICQYADENDIFSMGTTAALIVFAEQNIFLCNIGDSKIFRFDNTSLKQLSVDHLAPAPVGMKPSLSQNLGIPEDYMMIDPYITITEYHPGDIYVICSDGLTDMVKLDEMWEIIRNTDVEHLAGMLTERALKNGGKDNVTVIAVQARMDTK